MAFWKDLVNDDGGQKNSDRTCDTSSSSYELGTTSFGFSNVLFRFTDVNVPQGATIRSAVLRFYARNNTSSESYYFRICGENTDDSLAITTAVDNITSRTKTTAYNNMQLHDRPNGWCEEDVTSIIQEITDRVGWVKGNSLSLWLYVVSGASVSNISTSESSYAPKLSIVYDHYTTGELSPSANSGQFTNGERAYSSDNSYATIIDPSTSGKSHVYYDFNIPDLTNYKITDIRVKLEAKYSSETYFGSAKIDLSWDSGTSWTDVNNFQQNIGTSEKMYYYSGLPEGWSHNFTPSDLTNDNFRVRVLPYSDTWTADFSLDHITVEVFYETGSDDERGAKLIGCANVDSERGARLSCQVVKENRLGKAFGKIATGSVRSAHIIGGYSSKTAQSISLATPADMIDKAILWADETTPDDSSVTHYLSADGGSHWEEVSLNTEHEFINQGSDLKWKAVLNPASDLITTPSIQKIIVSYNTIEAGTDVNEERSGKVTGNQSDNSEKSASLKGYQTDFNERYLVVQGKDTDNDERVAKLGGVVVSNDERNALLVGKDTDNDNRAGKLTGKVSDNDDRAGAITGKAGNSDERLEKIRGKDIDNDERALKTSGIEGSSDERFSKISGIDEINSERQVKVIGKDTSNFSIESKIAGKDSSFSVVEAKIIGKASDDSQVSAKLTGFITDNSNRNALISGVDTTNSERLSKIIGKDTSNSSRNAVITGEDLANSETNLKLAGKDFIYNEKNLKTTGKDTSQVERQAGIIGKDLANSEISVKLKGVLSSNSLRSAKLIGFDTDNFEVNSRLKGKQFNNSLRSVKLSGKDLANSGRGAKLIGTGNFYGEDNKNWYEKEVITTITKDNKNWYEKEAKNYNSIDKKDWKIKF